MPEKYFLPLVMHFIRAIVLWIITTLSGADKDNSFFKSLFKAIIISAIITVLFHMADQIDLTGSNLIKISRFLNSLYFKAIISYIIIKLLYKFDWMSGLITWLIWFLVQFPLNIFHDKVIKLILNFF